MKTQTSTAVKCSGRGRGLASRRRSPQGEQGRTCARRTRQHFISTHVRASFLLQDLMRLWQTRWIFELGSWMRTRFFIKLNWLMSSPAVLLAPEPGSQILQTIIRPGGKDDTRSDRFGDEQHRTNVSCKQEEESRPRLRKNKTSLNGITWI